MNGAMVEGFHTVYDWGTLSQPPKGAVLVTVPALHLKVSLHPVSGELSIELSSKIYGGSVGGVCGKWTGMDSILCTRGGKVRARLTHGRG